MSNSDSQVNGWKGKLLRIDLGSGKASVEDLSEIVLAGYIGGRGLASKIFVDQVDPGVDPLNPCNKIVLSSGPLVGTLAPGASRTHVVSKSPLSGSISCLNTGGRFGAALRSAGYDALVVEGKSSAPVYLRVDGDLVELRDAKGLWGKPVSETQAIIQTAVDKEPRPTALGRLKKPTTRALAGEGAEVLCIGPAGERKDPVSSIVGSGQWSIGGAGFGAIMGSKNLKAIAVSGSSPATVANASEFVKAAAATMGLLKDNYVYYRRLAAYGTGAFVRIADAHGVLPTMNYRAGGFKGVRSITGEAVADSILKKTTACFGCPIPCGRLTAVNGLKGAAPEYEHLFGFGSNCGIDDLAAVTKAAYMCQDSGIDAVSAAAVVAETLELAEVGALKGGDQGLKFGDGESLLKLVAQMAAGEGLGDILCRGPQAVAEQFDHPDIFVGMNGQALAAYDPRGDEVTGLCFATSSNGLVHLPGGLVNGPTQLSESSIADDAVVETSIRLQDFAAAVDSVGLCPLMAATFSPDAVARLLSAATGVDYSAASLLSCGAAIWRAEKTFRARGGLADGLPPRLMKPLDEGRAAGRALRTDELLPAYYRARKWEVDDNGADS